MELDVTKKESGLNAVFKDARTGEKLRAAAPRLHDAAERYWDTIMRDGVLSRRMKELCLLTMQATATAMSAIGTERHIERALDAGASPADILEVMLLVAGVANHALYDAVPVLMEELELAGHTDAELPELSPEAAAIKADFIATRGFFNPDREAIARLAPSYFSALSRVSTEVWHSGSMTAKEREFVCIAMDVTVTHAYEPGLRLHIKRALQSGASRDEIMEVFELAALSGLEGYILGADTLAAAIPDTAE